MKTKKIWANLGVEDLERTTKFYSELGFKRNGHNASKELTSFIFGDDNFIIHFFIKEQFKWAVDGEMTDLKLGNEIIFSLSAESKNEVNEWVKIVEKAGGRIFAEPQDYGKGYFFGFSDPDGHKFNVLYWPE
ncbi:VOC family protein [Flavobacterium hydatis]|uniref:Glyoxalase n=1 Tax=Flavobacterium hydatis TaxID=991 RepID=A0A086AH97_FLAHY|nr:VOC family protein [Flavobacterium hydatis]KFF16061.1 glyoxalase [Flavobacterium hydatis]OXA97927.1 glyoxalase [Flavobacterium hydatis]